MYASSWVLTTCVNDSDPSLSICARRVSTDVTRHGWNVKKNNKNSRNNVHQTIDRIGLVWFSYIVYLRLSSLCVSKRLGVWRVCREEEGNGNIIVLNVRTIVYAVWLMFLSLDRYSYMHKENREIISHRALAVRKFEHMEWVNGYFCAVGIGSCLLIINLAIQRVIKIASKDPIEIWEPKHRSIA